jgi:hypothetical protein
VLRPLFHIGPFATEQECRSALAGLQGLFGDKHRNLEVRQQARRREKRIRIKISITLARLDHPDEDWAAHTVDISSMGGRLANSTEKVQLGEFLNIRYGQREAVFRVVWVGVADSPTAGQIGVECLTPETNILGSRSFAANR